MNQYLSTNCYFRLLNSIFFLGCIYVHDGNELRDMEPNQVRIEKRWKTNSKIPIFFVSYLSLKRKKSPYLFSQRIPRKPKQVPENNGVGICISNHGFNRNIDCGISSTKMCFIQTQIRRRGMFLCRQCHNFFVIKKRNERDISLQAMPQAES